MREYFFDSADLGDWSLGLTVGGNSRTASCDEMSLIVGMSVEGLSGGPDHQGKRPGSRWGAGVETVPGVPPNIKHQALAPLVTAGLGAGSAAATKPDRGAS